MNLSTGEKDLSIERRLRRVNAPLRVLVSKSDHKPIIFNQNA